jgi:hypothetical protein
MDLFFFVRFFHVLNAYLLHIIRQVSIILTTQGLLLWLFYDRNCILETISIEHS